MRIMTVGGIVQTEGPVHSRVADFEVKDGEITFHEGHFHCGDVVQLFEVADICMKRIVWEVRPSEGFKKAWEEEHGEVFDLERNGYGVKLMLRVDQATLVEIEQDIDRVDTHRHGR